MQNELLTIEEVAELLRVSPYTVRKYLRQGQFPGIKVGGQWRVRKTDLEAYINR